MDVGVVNDVNEKYASSSSSRPERLLAEPMPGSGTSRRSLPSRLRSSRWLAALLQVVERELSADDGDALEGRVAVLGDDLLPRRARGLRGSTAKIRPFGAPSSVWTKNARPNVSTLKCALIPTARGVQRRGRAFVSRSRKKTSVDVQPCEIVRNRKRPSRVRSAFWNVVGSPSLPFTSDVRLRVGPEPVEADLGPARALGGGDLRVDGEPRVVEAVPSGVHEADAYLAPSMTSTSETFPVATSIT